MGILESSFQQMKNCCFQTQNKNKQLYVKGLHFFDSIVEWEPDLHEKNSYSSVYDGNGFVSITSQNSAGDETPAQRLKFKLFACEIWKSGEKKTKAHTWM